MLLHGGAGTHSMSALADALSDHGEVLLPTHPGFDGTVRPVGLVSIHDLAAHYLQLLARDQRRDVVLVGNSMGGWLAVEMGLADSERFSRIIVLDPVGIEGTIVNPMAHEPLERLHLAFHNPRLAFGLAKPDTPPSVMVGNAAALKSYAGEHAMYDPTLHGRLPELRVPTTVVWGEADRIVDVAYGRRFAAAIPNAELVVLAEAGHFPQIEQRERVVRLITGR
jgi:pimeloyl-ACP methyl ester carboxylesterase